MSTPFWRAGPRAGLRGGRRQSCALLCGCDVRCARPVSLALLRCKVAHACSQAPFAFQTSRRLTRGRTGSGPLARRRDVVRACASVHSFAGGMACWVCAASRRLCWRSSRSCVRAGELSVNEAMEERERRVHRQGRAPLNLTRQVQTVRSQLPGAPCVCRCGRMSWARATPCVGAMAPAAPCLCCWLMFSSCCCWLIFSPCCVACCWPLLTLGPILGPILPPCPQQACGAGAALSARLAAVHARTHKRVLLAPPDPWLDPHVASLPAASAWCWCCLTSCCGSPRACCARCARRSMCRSTPPC